jgi:hypothetical protein
MLTCNRRRLFCAMKTNTSLIYTTSPIHKIKLLPKIIIFIKIQSKILSVRKRKFYFLKRQAKYLCAQVNRWKCIQLCVLTKDAYSQHKAECRWRALDTVAFNTSSATSQPHSRLAPSKRYVNFYSIYRISKFKFKCKTLNVYLF